MSNKTMHCEICGAHFRWEVPAEKVFWWRDDNGPPVLDFAGTVGSPKWTVLEATPCCERPVLFRLVVGGDDD